MVIRIIVDLFMICETIVDVFWKIIYEKLMLEFMFWILCKPYDTMINLMYSFNCKLIYDVWDYYAYVWKIEYIRFFYKRWFKLITHHVLYKQ